MKTLFPSVLNSSVDEIYECISCGFTPTHLTKTLFNELQEKYGEKLNFGWDTLKLGKCINKKRRNL